MIVKKTRDTATYNLLDRAMGIARSFSVYNRDQEFSPPKTKPNTGVVIFYHNNITGSMIGSHQDDSQLKKTTVTPVNRVNSRSTGSIFHRFWHIEVYQG